MSFADVAKLAKEGRNFECSNCPANVQSLRRCHEPRWDFSFESDGNPWPMYLHQGGTTYGFCPSKVMRDDIEANVLFSTLVLVAETGQLPEPGGLNAQPGWLLDELAWFLPQYSSHKFARQASMVFGSDDKPARATAAAPPAGASSRARR